MNRQASAAARLAGALLVAAIVVVACGSRTSHGTSAAQDPAAYGDTATTRAATAAATLTPAPPAPVPATPESPAASDPPAPTSSYGPPAAADDPVTGEIGAIDQLLQNLDGSLSGADPGTAGGE